MKDPLGVILDRIKADPAVLAIVGSAAKVSTQFPTTGVPCVVLGALSRTRRPFGPGSGRMDMQLGLYVAKCYAANDNTGDITASQLAGAVSDALHDVGPIRGSSQRLISKVYAPDLDGPTREPDNQYPRLDVRIDAYAATEAVA